MRHHFSANFWEARESSFDVEKSVLVESAEIAGLKPASLQHIAGAFGIVQITFENIYSPQPKHSSFVQREFAVRFRFANFRSDAGRHFANRAQTTRWLHLFAGFGRSRLRQIYAYHRRSFGQPVALKNSLFEAFLEIFREIERQFFRAGDDETQTAKLVRFDFAQITAKKSGCRQQER